MPRSTSSILWTVVLVVLALLGVAGALFGPRLYREGRAFVGPIAELAASEKAMATLNDDFPFRPPPRNLVREERLVVYLDISDDLRARYDEWQDLISELEGRQAQSWQQAKDVLAATRDVHRTQRDALRDHGMSPSELVWIEDLVLSWWRQIEPELSDSDRPAVLQALRRARQADLQLLAKLKRQHGNSPVLETMRRHLEASLASLDSSTMPQASDSLLENQRLFWRYRERIAPIEAATRNPLHQMIREQGRARVSDSEDRRSEPEHEPGLAGG